MSIKEGGVWSAGRIHRIQLIIFRMKRELQLSVLMHMIKLFNQGLETD